MNKQELDRLTPHEKRMRIAEACGKSIPNFCAPENHVSARLPMTHLPGALRNADSAWRCQVCGAFKWGSSVNWDLPEVDFPDYLNSLDAMHEAEQALQGDHQWQYCHALANICQGAMEAIHATATQRADAFLLTVG